MFIEHGDKLTYVTATFNCVKGGGRSEDGACGRDGVYECVGEEMNLMSEICGC